MADSPKPLTLGYRQPHPFSQIPLSSRASVQSLLTSLLDPLLPFFSPLRSRVRVPGATAVRFDQTASELEGLCRPLWGLACLLAGGGSYGSAQYWIDGIRAGVDPDGPEFWGYTRDNDQRMVEMCPLGFALAVVPGIWEGLGDKGRRDLEEWLAGGVNDKNMPDTNWLWFRVFANLGLKKNGGRFSQERLDKDIARLEVFYRGGGWSNDGPEGIHQMDYYSSSFAIQFLQLAYAKLAGEDGESEKERAKEFRSRAQQVALDLVHYYDAEGKIILLSLNTTLRYIGLADTDG